MAEDILGKGFGTKESQNIVSTPIPPTNIKHFQMAVYLELFIGIINNILYPYPPKPVAIIVTSLAIDVAIFLLLIWLIVRLRKSWTRWVVLVWFGYAIIFSILGFPGYYESTQNIYGASLSIIQVLLLVVSLYFIFSKNSRTWFKSETPNPIIP